MLQPIILTKETYHRAQSSPDHCAPHLPVRTSGFFAANAFTGLVNTLILLLLVATVVALVTRWLRIPYVIGLVLAGLLIPKQILSDAIGLNPEVILNLFLPILIFEAAINTDISRLRSTIKPIALLAGLGCFWRRRSPLFS